MTNSQRKQLAEMYKAREREAVVLAAEALLNALERGLAMPDAELRAEMRELRDELREAKAGGWKQVAEMELPSERGGRDGQG